jgi:signal transduction histidine kinase/CheY-like chemotaxis protein
LNIKEFAVNAFNIGIRSELSIEEKQRVRLTNLVALIPLIAYIFYVGYGFVYDQWFSAALAGTMIVLTVISLILNKARKYGMAKVILFGLNSLSLWLTYHVFNVNYAALSSFFPIIFCFAFFFDFEKERKYLIWATSIVSVAIISSFLLPRQLIYAINLEAAVRDSSNLYHILISFFLTGLVVWVILKNQTKTTQLLSKAKEEAEKYTRLQTDFLANVSHEIRTPLNGIVGITELLKSNTSEEETSQYLKTIRASGHLLSSIINDVLDVSKLEAQKIVLQKKAFRLESSIVNCVNITSTALATQKVFLNSVIDSNIPKYVSGDRNRLEQILSNLLNNAIKFTKEGKIEISAQLLNVTNNTVEIQFAISDTGIGISDQEQEQLFNRFYQVNSSKNRIYRGTGLGLSICKNLVELMGGRLKVSSKPNIGSTFSFHAFFEKAQQQQLEIVTHLTKDLGHLKVLVVEDNAVNRMVITKMLNQFNIDSAVAHDGHEAVLKVQSERFDVILMDIQMPNLDGLDATKVIRQIEKIRQPKIIALTANYSNEDIKKATQSGMDDYLTKPLLIKELERVLTKYATP